MYLIKYFLILIICQLSIVVFAQKVKINDVKGTCMVKNISPEQAKQKAIDAAKSEVLRKAGVSEWIQSVDVLQTTEDKGSVKDYFYNLTSVEIQGNIIEWNLVSEKLDLIDGNIIQEVVIDAVVKKYKSKKDKSFFCSINGVKTKYSSQDKLEFLISPSSKCYIEMFLLDGKNDVFRLYPNENEKMNSFFKPNISHKFPQSSYFDYTLYTDLEKERNHLFVLLTKKKYDCEENLDINSFVKYIYSIEPDQRFLEILEFTIYNKD